MYDSAGRRQSKVISGTQTNFLYDLANPVQELSGTTPTANLLTGGLDEYFTRTDSFGAATFLTDALGSTAALTNSVGAVQTQYSFDPFGNTSAAGTSGTNSFLYTGRESDGTGLYYSRARYYNSQIGRFMSEDPIRFKGGLNFYSYVHNSPVNFTDPSGLCPQQQQQSCPPMGNAPSPSQYQAAGYVAQDSWLFGYGVGGLSNLGALSMFKRGWLLDAQVLYGGSPAYANYAYGVYTSAAGIPLSVALAGANWYGTNNSSYTGQEMDPNYPGIPVSNVTNIINGYNDQQNGTLCLTN